MSWKPLWVSIALAVVWTLATLWTVRLADAPAPALRYYVVSTPQSSYQVEAHGVRSRDACTTFVRDGLEIAGACGSHVWSEAREVETPTAKGLVY